MTTAAQLLLILAILGGAWLAWAFAGWHFEPVRQRRASAKRRLREHERNVAKARARRAAR